MDKHEFRIVDPGGSVSDPIEHLPINVWPRSDELPYETQQRLRYTNSITTVDIPAGFKLDFASVPRLLWFLFPRVGRYARAAMVHDVLYRHGEVDRTQADSLFLSIMRRDQTPRWQRWPMYAAVRAFGWIAWRRLRDVQKYGVEKAHEERSERWARRILILLGVLLFLGIGSLVMGQNCPPGVVCNVPQPAAHAGQQAAPAAVVRIVRGSSMGTGTLVAHGADRSYYLTAAHVLAGETAEPRVIGPQVGRHRARIVAVDRQHDLAVLETARVNATPIPPAYVTSPTGPLYAGGLGGSGQWRAVRGPVLGFASPSDAVYPSLYLRGAIRSGDSGGPIVNTRGQLVAVAWGCSRGQAYGFGGRPLRNLLRRVFGRDRTVRLPAVFVTPSPPGSTSPPSGVRGGAAPVASPQPSGRQVSQYPASGFPASPAAPAWPSLPATPEPGAAPTTPTTTPTTPPSTTPSTTPSRLERIREFVAGGVSAWSALAAGGPVGLGLLGAGWLISRRMNAKRGDGGPRGDGFPWRVIGPDGREHPATRFPQQPAA